jgi:FAD/FMN-containing dehydrogenase
MSDPPHGDSLRRDLAALLGDDAVSHDAADRERLRPRPLAATAPRDPRRRGAPRGPRAVVWPRSDAQLAGPRRARAARGRAPHALRGGQRRGGRGAVRPPHRLAVDLKRMPRSLRSVDLREGRCDRRRGRARRAPRASSSVGAAPRWGISRRRIYCSTVGGWVVTRSAGQCSGRYGKIEDMVLGLDGVLGDGSAYSVDGASADAPSTTARCSSAPRALFGFVSRARRSGCGPRRRRGSGAAFTFSLHARRVGGHARALPARACAPP